MNKRAHWLSIFSGVMHLFIGLSAFFEIVPRFLPPSWVIIYRLPGGEWIYPLAWIATGIVASGGASYSFGLRLGFRMSSALFLIWAIAGIFAWREGIGGNPQGILANSFTAGCTLVLSYYVSAGIRSDKAEIRSDKIDRQVERLAEQVHQSNE